MHLDFFLYTNLSSIYIWVNSFSFFRLLKENTRRSWRLFENMNALHLRHFFSSHQPFGQNKVHSQHQYTPGHRRCRELHYLVIINGERTYFGTARNLSKTSQPFRSFFLCTVLFFCTRRHWLFRTVSSLLGWRPRLILFWKNVIGDRWVLPFFFWR